MHEWIETEWDDLMRFDTIYLAIESDGAGMTAIHELVDFGLTMPANAFTLAAICGAALAVGSRQPDKSRQPGGNEVTQREASPLSNPFEKID